MGVLDRRSRSFSVTLPARERAATLDILVDAMGRVNFGPEVHDRKGLHGPVTLDGTQLTGWQIYNLPLDSAMLANLEYADLPAQPLAGPAFYRLTIDLADPGDTFLDMRSWGKGYTWVNGHNLGRYWNIGPQQTMYLPGCWLKRGRNEIIILDLLGPQNPVIAGLRNRFLTNSDPNLISRGRNHGEADRSQPFA